MRIFNNIRTLCFSDMGRPGSFRGYQGGEELDLGLLKILADWI